MKPPVETVRITKHGRDQLIKLRRITGIQQWNVLCRWALAASLKEPTPPMDPPGGFEGGVEIAWRVFAGDYSDYFTAVLTQHLTSNGYLVSDKDALSRMLRAHVHRGLNYLSSGTEIRSISDFLGRWT